MKKIMIFNSLYSPNILGGVERFVQVIVESLVEDGLHVVIVNTSDIDSESVLNGVKIYYVKIPNLYLVYYSKSKNAILKIFWYVFDLCNFFSKTKINKIIVKECLEFIYINNLIGFFFYLFKIVKFNKI